MCECQHETRLLREKSTAPQRRPSEGLRRSTRRKRSIGIIRTCHLPKMFPLASGMAVSAEAAHAATTAEAECWPWARLPAMGIHHTLSVRSQQQAIVDGPRGRPQWHLEHTSGPKQQLLEPPAYDNPAYENLLAMYHCVKLSSHCCTG